MRIIIIAAGEGTRWGNYQGVPKHFVEIDGEPIIKRTVRLLNQDKYKDKNLEIYVVGPNKKYSIPGSKLFIPNQDPSNGDLDKFMNSRELWSNNKKTYIIYGDVYFTEIGMDFIINNPNNHFTLHCRPFASNYTGTSWGECFALSFDYGYNKKLDRAFQRIKELFKKGVLTRMGGWEVYKIMLNDLYPEDMMKRHWLTGHNINTIDDWTDDFDYQPDYDRFIKRRKEFGL